MTEGFMSFAVDPVEFLCKIVDWGPDSAVGADNLSRWRWTITGPNGEVVMFGNNAEPEGAIAAAVDWMKENHPAESYAIVGKSGRVETP